VNALTLYALEKTSSKSEPSRSTGSPSYTTWLISNDGRVSSSRLTVTPSAPRETTEPGKSASSRVSVTSSPSALMKVMPETAEASVPLASPEPWVPVEQAPATEMCGSDPRLCRARPSACSAAVTSPYRSPADTVTVSSPTVITRGKLATDTSVPVVSAIRLNE
jgi:hypothetical protein